MEGHDDCDGDPTGQDSIVSEKTDPSQKQIVLGGRDDCDGDAQRLCQVRK